MDGVLADVQQSQRAAIAATASSFGAPVTSAQVATAMRSGDAANDWVVTQRLIETAGTDASLYDVTARYQSIYLSLRERERLIPSGALLERLAARRPLALVTGRPRAEAQWFLDRAGVASLFGTLVAMEDASPKPDPAPVQLALERLGVRRAWMIGDTPDDVRGARRAGVLPLGVVAPGDDPSLAAAALRDAGVAHVLDRLSDLLELLP
jgi:HAD superfamily hydrolase (TIGR01548 family)